MQSEERGNAYLTDNDRKLSHFKQANLAFSAKLFTQAADLYELAMKEQPALSDHCRFNRNLALRKAEILSGLNANAQSTTFLRNGVSDSPIVERTPAFLDTKYSNGIIKSSLPVKHEELVTIIMPSYNNEEWISRAIHSALSQQEVRIELLVVDDGSTDGSVRVARKIAENVPNMRVISLLRNFGCYYARNIGVLSASGIYVTILDSDDIMSPDQIVLQMDALKANPSAVASRCRLRRWNSDYSHPLSDLKFGEATLLWRRDLVNSIGWYDSVRFGGDSEFRSRIQETLGRSAIISIPDELYFARTVDSSLTTNSKSHASSLVGDKLELKLSDSRKAYADAFATWHKKAKSAKINDDNKINIAFPMMSRPFQLWANEQNASPSLGHKRIGAIASFPPRRESLKVVIEAVLPQLDELILYLNNYNDVPEFAYHSKIRAILSKEAKGDLRDNGKFFDLPKGDDSYVFTFDDDLLYPKDYVAWMIHYIEMLGRSCIVGLHGVVFPESDFTSLKQRTVYGFSHEHIGHFVDLLGTGTTAWHSSTIKLSVDDFKTTGVCDLWFSAIAAKHKIPFFSIPRKKGWLQEVKRHEECLYQEALSQPENYFTVYHSFVEPVVNKGCCRKQMEVRFAREFDCDVLLAAGIELCRIE